MLTDSDVTRGGNGGPRRASVDTSPGQSTITGKTMPVRGGGRAADLLGELTEKLGAADVLAESRAVARRVARMGDAK